VATDARLRLFLALRLPRGVLDAIEHWQHAHLHGVRPVTRENLHVTLAFLGHRPAGELDAVLGELRAAAAAAGPDLRLAATGYRETGSVAMLVHEDVGGGATALAADLHGRLEQLGVYRREARPWLPHVTVARFKKPPGLRIEPPGLGTYVPSDAAAFLSRLRPGGAQYEVVEAVALGGG
jgi:2'-5' RNA ligase